MSLNANSAAVTVRGLTRTFGDQVAVNNLNLSVPHGEVYGLLGPNGAGKTTTLKIMAGLLSADEGHIRIAGATVRPWKMDFEAHKKLGYLSEDLSLIHISEPTRRTPISYAVFCLKKKKYI